MVIEGIEELLLGRFRDARVLDEGVRDIVGCHTIEQELVMGLVLGLVLSPLET